MKQFIEGTTRRVMTAPGRPCEADLLGRHWRLSVRQAAGGWQVPLAERARRGDEIISGRALGTVGRAGLEASSRSTGDTGFDAAGMTAAR